MSKELPHEVQNLAAIDGALTPHSGQNLGVIINNKHLF
jgi:hypothetical protein